MYATPRACASIIGQHEAPACAKQVGKNIGLVAAWSRALDWSPTTCMPSAVRVRDYIT